MKVVTAAAVVDGVRLRGWVVVVAVVVAVVLLALGIAPVRLTAAQILPIPPLALVLMLALMLALALELALVPVLALISPPKKRFRARSER